MSTTKAVILARGLGTRMRRAFAGDRDQFAEAGLKGMIDVGRPFLDYVISALADAGILDVCLVIGPEHAAVHEYYGAMTTRRVRINFATQAEPLGTADALLAAESFAAGNHVLVLNSDNYYKVHTLRALRELNGPGAAVFERDALIRGSNISADRIASYAVVEFSADGVLERIVEKPGTDAIAALPDPAYVSMNSWSMPPEIFDACRAITPSPRGELEIQSAVQYAIDTLGVRFHVLTFHDGVLDLTQRSDIPAVTAALEGFTPVL
ncbi:MAG TPA: nucleotidyltransferase family protein [Longimicrobiales bacterium]